MDEGDRKVERGWEEMLRRRGREKQGEGEEE